jgi:hypothetical protein
MSPGVPLAPEDAARLWMGTRAHPLAVTAVLELRGALGREELAARVERRLLAHARFRSAIVERGALEAPRWEERRVELDWHIQERSAGSDAHALERVATECARAPFDPERPRWRAWLVQREGASSAVVVRVHHAIADGHALLRVLLGVTDEGQDLSPEDERKDAPLPWPSPAEALARARTIARVLARRRDALSAGAPWRGGVRYMWSDPLPLEPLKAASHRLGAHLTELVLAALGTALAGLLPRRPHPLHALVPVALPAEGGGIGNHFASVFVPLPVGEAPLAARVARVTEAMRAARAEVAVSASRSLVRMAGLLGAHVEHVGIALLSRRASVVVSSMVGPPVPVHVCGREVTRIVPFAPAPGSVPLAVGAMGYAGSLQLSLAAAPRVAEPWSVLSTLRAELCRASGLGA